jgi:outer membrane protein OmpA-like peptidoglycan-associated protein
MTGSGAASRGSVRSARAWRAYDRANLLVAALLALAGVAWWAGHLADRRADEAAALADEQPTGSPVRMRLSDSALDFRREGDRVVLRGQVRDVASRGVLVQAAQRAFGLDKVADQLVVDASADALDWAASAEAMFTTLHRAGAELDGVRVLGHAVSLQGMAADAARQQAVEAQARQWFGARFQIDNLIQVTPAPSVAQAAASAPAEPRARESRSDACEGLRQGIELRFRADGQVPAAAGRSQLDALAGCLAQGRWQVSSALDGRDAEAVREAAARARARSVAAYLAQRGVAADRLQAAASPSDKPAPVGAPRDRHVRIAPAD